MKNVKLFIWDFDGTLLDTYPFTTLCLKRALADYGYEISQTEILEKMMENIPYAVKYYREKFQLQELSAQFAQYRAKEAESPVRIFPGVREVLKRVQEIGAANDIFTNRGKTIYPMLSQLGILEDFREIVTAADPAFVVKPAPDTFRYLMEKYGGTPENTVMIGDRRCDLESGYAAPCWTCHLLTPAVPQYPACDWRIKNFWEMLKLLED